MIFLAPAAQGLDFSYSGYVKSYLLLQDEVEIENSPEEIPASAQWQNAARFMADLFTEGKGNYQLHYEVQPVYYTDPKQAAQAGGIGSTLSIGRNRYRVKDLDPILAEDDHWVVFQNLDRLNYQYYTDSGDLTVGRQVIAFGSARFVNPTDIFVPFNIQTLNQEYRVGIDALRYQAELGPFALIDGGLILGEDAEKENSAAFIRGKNSVAGNDFEAMYILRDESWLLGGGLERAIYDMGFWFETAYMYLRDQDEDSYWRHSIGVDYAFSESVIGMIEYHFNGAGATDPDQYLELLELEPYQKAGVYLLGQQYLIPALSWTATALTHVTASGFFNLNDRSVFLSIVAEQSWSDNLYSDFGTYLSLGDNPSFDPASGQIDPGSEFGSFPISLYASIRYYY